jgi:4-amino-4-deoxy-L-arabinose transferase-like glycosyltransferase
MNSANGARLLLAFLLICQAALLIRPSRPFNGDEPYYVDKARSFFEHGRFEHVSAEALAVERGERWGTSDWRPQGYPLFVAAVSLGDFRDSSLRPRVAAAQFALIAAAVWLLFEIMTPRLGREHLLATTAVLGAVPWPYDFAASLSPDSLTASITFFSTVILWRALEKENTLLMFAGAFLMSTTLLLRPEMIVLAPVSLGAVVLLRRFDRHTLLKRAAACAAAFTIVASAQVAYRINVTGHPGFFGGLHIRDSGAFAWTNTWLGSENEAYNFVYGLSSGDVPALPARAFSDDEERRAVERVIFLDRTRHSYGPDLDAEFQRLAEKRKHEHPFLAIVATRLWHSVHLWLNLETSSQLLNALANVPSLIRRPILGGLLLVKLALLALFVVGAMRARKSRAPALIMLCAVIVVGRTLVLGTALNWTAHRYMLPAWLPLLACAIGGLQTWTSRAAQPLPGDPARADR